MDASCVLGYILNGNAVFFQGMRSFDSLYGSLRMTEGRGVGRK